MGRVIVERRTDKSWFSVAVIPFQEIPIGTPVKISHVHWESTATQSMGPRFYFLVVKEIVH